MIQFDVNPADRDVLDIGTTAAERGGREREQIFAWNADWSRNWGFTDYYGIANFKSKLITSSNTISEESNTDFNVFYSPANKQITIKSSNVFSATLYNIAGQAMSSQFINGKMSVANMKSGIYIINAKDASGNRVGSKKVAIF